MKPFSPLAKALFVMPLLFVATAKADDKAWKPADAPKQNYKKAKSNKGDRKVASLEANRSEYRSTRSVPQKDGPEFKLGVAIGAGMQSENSAAGGNLDVGTAPSVGITADIKAWRYLGIEEDAFFQLSGSTPDIGGSKDSAMGMGSFTTIKGQYAFWLLDMKVTPKVGLGFAYERRTGKSESVASTVEASTSTMGVYGTAGLEVEPFRNFTISGDYARSITAETLIKSGTVEQAASNSKFDRIRVGGFYQFMPRVHGGLQYVQRGVSFSQPTLTPGVGADGSQTLRQVQAVFQYEL